MKTTDKNPEPATGKAGGNDMHTPGPWVQHTADGKTYASVRAVNGGVVADCGSRSDLTAQANARLIASAPSLLAENRRLRAVLRTLVEAPDIYQADMQAARAALAQDGRGE